MKIKVKTRLIYGFICFLTFATIFFVGFTRNNPIINVDSAQSNNSRLFSTTDEANVTFSILLPSQNRAEPFETATIYCSLINLGNTTAHNISVTLLSKSDTVPGYAMEQVQNCNPLGPGKTSSFLTFSIQKSFPGNYSYIVNVQYNYTSGSTPYHKSINGTIIQIEVKLRYLPEVEFYLEVESGNTRLIMRFMNDNCYTNLTYQVLLQNPDGMPEIFDVPVPGIYFNPNHSRRMDYVIPFTVDQLNLWDRVIYFFNGEIDQEITLFYQLSVNDTAGTVYAIRRWFESDITIIDGSHLSIPCLLEATSMDYLLYLVIILGILVVGMMIPRKIGKKSESEFEKMPRYDKSVYLAGHLNSFDLFIQRRAMLEWLKPQGEYFSLYKRLKVIQYSRIGIALGALTCIPLLLIGIAWQNYILLGGSAIGLPVCVILILVLNKIEFAKLESIFPVYQKDHPEIQLISQELWIYLKNYKSIRGLVGGFISYAIALSGTLVLCFFQYLHTTNVVFLCIIGGCSLGLIFGVIFYMSFEYKTTISFTHVALSLPLGLIFSSVNFDLNQVPFIIPFSLFITVLLVGFYFLNRLIYRMVEPELIRKIIQDLSEYFKEGQEIYLPRWTWIFTKERFPLLLKSIQESALPLKIEKTSLIKGI